MSSKKKTIKSNYNASDDVLAEIQIDKKLKIKILRYKDAFYIDLRKYFGIYPSRKGIRIPVGVFMDITKNKDVIDGIKKTLG